MTETAAPTNTPSITPTTTVTPTIPTNTWTPTRPPTLTPTFTLTPTVTTTPTPSSTPFALFAPELDSLILQTICLAVDANGVGDQIEDTIRLIMGDIGVSLAADGQPCDATLSINVNYEPLSAVYMLPAANGQTTTETCYTGAAAHGDVRLANPESATLVSLPVEARLEPPAEITISFGLEGSPGCRERDEAPYRELDGDIKRAVFDNVMQVWGPYLLIHALGHTSTLQLAQATLRRHEEIWTPHLFAIIEDGNDWERWLAAQALYVLYTWDAIDADTLVPILVWGLDKSATRLMSARMLESMGPVAETAVPALRQLLEGEYIPHVSEAGYEALEQIAPGSISESVLYVQQLANPSEDVRDGAVDHLVDMGQEAIEALLHGLQRDNEDIRSGSGLALSRMEIEPSPAVISALIDALADQRGNVRLNTMCALSHFAEYVPPEATPMILQLLGADEDTRIRIYAVRVLGGMSEPSTETLSALFSAAYDEDPAVRLEAIRQVGALGSGVDEVVPILIDALHDERSRIQEAAADELIDIGPAAADAVPALIEMLTGESPIIAAVEALGAIGPAATDAIPVLVEVLENGGFYHRSRVVEALEAITGQSLGEDVDSWQRWWEEHQQ